eukprot:TRINITY_DN5559_c0_g1_i10.p1 TRINITY_DN5559_c0_g1~~TRINITY_DN5559_c0_g1_i10.p1  ORF type:complete len:549 (-),score=128.39 TRINITY_DN5559_c0_g1_i10:487-2133(-)
MNSPSQGRGHQSANRSSCSNAKQRFTIWAKTKWRAIAKHFWSRKAITDRDRVILSPWEEWQKYNRFPVEVLLHTGLLVIVIVQIMLMAYQFTGYNKSNEDTFHKYFFPEEYRDGIFSIDDCINVINQTVYNYYNFPLQSVDRFEVLRNENQTVVPPIMTVWQFKSLSREFFNFSNFEESIYSFGDFTTEELSYYLTPDNPLGPMANATNLHRLFYQLKHFTITFSFRNLDIGGLTPIPYTWTIEQRYDLSQGAEIEFDLNTDLRFIRTKGISALDVFTVTAVLIVVLACASLAMSAINVQMHYSIFQRVKSKYKRYCHMADATDIFPTWEHIHWKLKFWFFGGWPIHNIIASLTLIMSCFFGFFTQYGASINEWYNILTGIGCLMLCIKMLRYLGYYRDFYALTLTWASSFFRTISFLVTVSPIFVGYALFGMLNFAQYATRFENFNITSITLYALLLGDDVRGAFVELEENSYPYPFIPKIYLFTFVTFFTTSVLNVFIFIIEDAYHVSKTGFMTPVRGNPRAKQAGEIGQQQRSTLELQPSAIDHI